MKIILAILSTFVFSTFLCAEKSKEGTTTQVNVDQNLLKHVISSYHSNRKNIFYGDALMDINFGDKNGEIQELDRLMINGDGIPLIIRLLYAERLLSNESLRLSLVSMKMQTSSGFAEKTLAKEQEKVSKDLKNIREALKRIKLTDTNNGK